MFLDLGGQDEGRGDEGDYPTPTGAEATTSAVAAYSVGFFSACSMSVAAAARA
jgi:hypothetical protein